MRLLAPLTLAESRPPLTARASLFMARIARCLNGCPLKRPGHRPTGFLQQESLLAVGL